VRDQVFVRPEAGAHLLYFGRRGPHPQRSCLVDDDPSRAAGCIFAIEDVATVAATAATFALQSTPVSASATAWLQLTPWMALGSFAFATPTLPTGVWYDWPYPAEQDGTVWVAVPRLQLEGEEGGMANHTTYM
jgi:hypothetical protein